MTEHQMIDIDGDPEPVCQRILMRLRERFYEVSNERRAKTSFCMRERLK